MKFKLGPGALIRFAPDATPNGGQELPAADPNPDTPVQDAGQGDGGGQPQPGAAGKVEDLPDWAQSIIKELRGENARRRKAEQDQAAAAAKAEEERLAQQNEWQKLAEQRQARIAELEPLTERTAKLEAILAQQLASAIKDWPTELKQLDPGDGADLLARLDWMQKSQPLAQKLMERPTTPGNVPAPKPNGGAKPTDEAARAGQARWSMNQF